MFFFTELLCTLDEKSFANPTFEEKAFSISEYEKNSEHWKSKDSLDPFCINFLYSSDLSTSFRNFLYPNPPVSLVISPMYESGKLVLISIGFLG